MLLTEAEKLQGPEIAVDRQQEDRPHKLAEKEVETEMYPIVAEDNVTEAQ